ncbi:MAG: SRPBCC family protein [Nocardioidaceae bacterium]
MKLTNSVRIDRAPAEVLDAFLDLERVAGCMPGARLLGSPADDTYDGEVTVKVGPLGAAYAGRLTLLEVDRDRGRLTMRAKGREKNGAGNADAYVVAEVRADGDGTLVEIATDLTVRGKVAQFGRGVIGDVADRIMQTFASNVEEMLAGGTTELRGATAPPAPTTSAATTGEALDVWELVVRPALKRYAVPVGTVVLAGVAAYLGARVGARRRRRPRSLHAVRHRR